MPLVGLHAGPAELHSALLAEKPLRLGLVFFAELVVLVLLLELASELEGEIVLHEVQSVVHLDVIGILVLAGVAQEELSARADFQLDALLAQSVSTSQIQRNEFLVVENFLTSWTIHIIIRTRLFFNYSSSPQSSKG